LRLVKHVAPGHTKKSVALKATVRQQFEANRDLVDETRIAAKKADAVRALSNYLLLDSAQKDTKLSSAMNDYHESSVEEAKSTKQQARGTNSKTGRSTGLTK
jgi:hypothetical protein